MNRSLLKQLAYGLQQYVTLLAVVLWLGGFTFYAACVVRVASRVLGGTEQGYVTQHVMSMLQWIAVVMLGFILFDIILYAKTNLKMVTLLRAVAWLTMAITTGVLFLVHAQMSNLMDSETLSMPDFERFSPLHQRYQFVATVYWCACMLDLAFLLHTHKRFALLSEESATLGPEV